MQGWAISFSYTWKSYHWSAKMNSIQRFDFVSCVFSQLRVTCRVNKVHTKHWLQSSVGHHQSLYTLSATAVIVQVKIHRRESIFVVLLTCIVHSQWTKAVNCFIKQNIVLRFPGLEVIRAMSNLFFFFSQLMTHSLLSRMNTEEFSIKLHWGYQNWNMFFVSFTHEVKHLLTSPPSHNGVGYYDMLPN